MLRKLIFIARNSCKDKLSYLQGPSMERAWIAKRVLWPNLKNQQMGSGTRCHKYSTFFREHFIMGISLPQCSPGFCAHKLDYDKDQKGPNTRIRRESRTTEVCDLKNKISFPFFPGLRYMSIPKLPLSPNGA